MTDYTERAAAILPCECESDADPMVRPMHAGYCPARLRPAVAAALREVAEDHTSVTDALWSRIETHEGTLARARQEERERFRRWAQDRGPSWQATVADIDLYAHHVHGDCIGCRYGWPLDGEDHVLPRNTRGDIPSRCAAIRAGENTDTHSRASEPER